MNPSEDDPHADDRRTPPGGILRRTRAWLDATPAELMGLTVLLAGAIAVTAVTFWDAGQRPVHLPPAASVGSASSPESGTSGHPADSSGPGTPPSTDEDTGELVVHVSGAVRTPGVVTLAPSARVADAIAAAGGVAQDADLERLNLARILLDGEQVHVPRPGEDPPVTSSGPPADGAGTTPDGKIDLNLATQEQLETLPGIGPAKAAAIITHRETDGPFAVAGDLRAVPGIGERTFQQLADLVTVG